MRGSRSTLRHVIRQQATHDQLTGLANRARPMDELARIERAVGEPIDTARGPVTVGVSIGAVTLPASTVAKQSPDTMITDLLHAAIPRCTRPSATGAARGSCNTPGPPES
ncbi:hypothetical protein [Jidongwangia harbinensis]|uniref:hypothetical protein n=1 Tax=Jidongwangia harbinensis TaxID=2878561 RepID=UPI001CDA5456|nr:hypothetical protein [Jidongwangia harbinensis]MCA2211671.1 hypothetical protein [Jidongwangia harbinensis]